ncbi:hypothetical protein ACFC8N_34050 [Streptomyces sp. NPDC055966]|uniref:hypothetical protein n=1 Tax=Streptomyces sp. NPDC055966 TaxID=3345669 RepID=UPI0035DC5E12
MGIPVTPTSDTALPRPFTPLSSFSAAAVRRAVSADTDASNSEARADADEAAADAEARAEEMAADADDASADGIVPENDAVFGEVGVPGVEEPPEEPLLPHDVSAPATAAQASAMAARCRRHRPRGGTTRSWEGMRSSFGPGLLDLIVGTRHVARDSAWT